MPPRLLLAVSGFLHAVRGCYIQGQDSGVCTDMADKETLLDMPFCGPVVSTYPSACLPKEFPYFPNHTLAAKDAWVSNFYSTAVARRLQLEQPNMGGASPLPWETGPSGVTVRFTKRDDCASAYKNYLCFMNFPRCDVGGNSLNLCTSVCTNFFKACNYGKDMVRCGPPQYFGGAEPEGSMNLDNAGVPIYLRAPFPGLPFTANAFTPGGVTEYPICTPATGGALSHTLHTHNLLLLVAVCVLRALGTPQW